MTKPKKPKGDPPSCGQYTTAMATTWATVQQKFQELQAARVAEENAATAYAADGSEANRVALANAIAARSRAERAFEQALMDWAGGQMTLNSCLAPPSSPPIP
jgi:hypothetical protein